jgi:hypothetical protein
MTKDHLKEIDRKKPAANDFLSGWDAAEAGIGYHREASSDWQMGWRLWHHEHGAKRSSSSWH